MFTLKQVIYLALAVLVIYAPGSATDFAAAGVQFDSVGLNTYIVHPLVAIEWAYPRDTTINLNFRVTVDDSVVGEEILMVSGCVAIQCVNQNPCTGATCRVCINNKAYDGTCYVRDRDPGLGTCTCRTKSSAPSSIIAQIVDGQSVKVELDFLNGITEWDEGNNVCEVVFGQHAAIPTLSEWGMIIFVVLLAGWMAFVVIRRWKASHAGA